MSVYMCMYVHIYMPKKKNNDNDLASFIIPTYWELEEIMWDNTKVEFSLNSENK